jgi:hypothetical protein
MFFPRLRNQAKWAFVFLILVFGGGFVFLGVGSGGLDLGQLLRDAFGNTGSSGTSISEAQKRVDERPSALRRKDLANALRRRAAPMTRSYLDELHEAEAEGRHGARASWSVDFSRPTGISAKHSWRPWQRCSPLFRPRH